MKSIKNIYLLIGATIFIILVNTILFLHQSRVNERKYYSIGKTYEIIETANLLLHTIKDAEGGQRGYLITNDTSYLIPYNSARLKINGLYFKFYSLVNPAHLKKYRFDALHKAIIIKLIELQKTVKRQKEGNIEHAYRIVESNIGKNSMKAINSIINIIIKSEKKQININNRLLEKSNNTIQVFAIISNYFLLIIIVLALYNIIRNRRKIAVLFAQVAHKSRQLEMQKNELAKLSDNLLKQNTELERFAYVASHDIRSPAMNQDALLRLYAESRDEEEKEILFKSMQEVAQNLIVKLNDLIETLKFQYNAADSKNLILFEDIFQKIVKNLSIDITELKADIKSDFSEAPGISIPETYLESILQNLLSNALKYRHPDRHPVIEIRSYHNRAHTCFRISDNGLGIDLEKYGNSIFGLYKTFHNNADSKGVGLYITRSQIIAMGGSIEVQSVPGEGTTFIICF